MFEFLKILIRTGNFFSLVLNTAVQAYKLVIKFNKAKDLFYLGKHPNGIICHDNILLILKLKYT